MKTIKPLNELFREMPLIESVQVLIIELEKCTDSLCDASDDRQVVAEQVRGLFLSYTRQSYHTREASILKMLETPKATAAPKTISPVAPPPAAKKTTEPKA